jgi:hypothetical protein
MKRRGLPFPSRQTRARAASPSVASPLKYVTRWMALNGTRNAPSTRATACSSTASQSQSATGSFTPHQPRFHKVPSGISSCRAVSRLRSRSVQACGCIAMYLGMATPSIAARA